MCGARAARLAALGVNTVCVDGARASHPSFAGLHRQVSFAAIRTGGQLLGRRMSGAPCTERMHSSTRRQLKPPTLPLVPDTGGHKGERLVYPVPSSSTAGQRTSTCRVCRAWGRRGTTVTAGSSSQPVRMSEAGSESSAGGQSSTRNSDDDLRRRRCAPLTCVDGGGMQRSVAARSRRPCLPAPDTSVDCPLVRLRPSRGPWGGALPQGPQGRREGTCCQGTTRSRSFPSYSQT